MPFDFSSILNAQREKLDAELAQARADLEAYRLNDDSHGTMAAADRILAIDTMYNALAARANQYMAHQQAQPRGNAYGLTDDEIDIAKNSHSGGTVEQRIEDYAKQKQKLQYMRATGQYRDDQGTVKR